MKCFSFIENRILEGAPSSYVSTMGGTIIKDASIRFYINDANAELLAKCAKERYKDLFLYGYTELIPDNGPGALFPEDSFLLDISIDQYISRKDDGCMRIQCNDTRVLLGCLPDAQITTPSGIIKKVKGKVKIVTDIVATNEPITQDNVMVVEA